MKPEDIKNYKEFLALIERYETISIKEIEKQNFRFSTSRTPQRKLTGFGDHKKCILCKVINKDCDDCIYTKLTEEKCYQGVNSRSYNEIAHAETPQELLEAYRRRAKHMRNILTLKTQNHE